MHPRRPRGYPGVGRKGATKVFKRGRKSPWLPGPPCWLPTLTISYRIISKRSSECWLLIGHKKCFVLLCPIGEHHRLSPFCVFVHDCYCLAVLYCTCPVRCSPRLCPIRSQHLLDYLIRLTSPWVSEDYFYAALSENIKFPCPLLSLFPLYFSGIRPETHSEGMFSWFPFFFPIKVRAV